MNEATAIIGADLIRYQSHLEFVDGFAELIDPQGFNVIVDETTHEEFVGVTLTTLLILFKLKNQEEPFEGSLTLPYIIYKQIAYKVKIGDTNVH